MSEVGRTVGSDDDADCVEHVWVLDGVHLSMQRGTEKTEHCTRCPAVRYVPDTARSRREPLRPAR